MLFAAQDALPRAVRKANEGEAFAPAVAVGNERDLLDRSEGAKILLQSVLGRPPIQSADKNPVDLSKLTI